MSLTLVKQGTTDEFSFGGSGSDPVSLTAALNDTGGTLDTNVVTTELLATTHEYTDITLDIPSEDTSIDFKFSLDNVNWHDDLDSSPSGDLAAGTIPEPDATGGDVRQTVYIKAVVDNDGTVSANTYEDAQVSLAFTENQTP
jgi:hypothetical protein